MCVFCWCKYNCFHRVLRCWLNKNISWRSWRPCRGLCPGLCSDRPIWTPELVTNPDKASVRIRRDMVLNTEGSTYTTPLIALSCELKCAVRFSRKSIIPLLKFAIFCQNNMHLIAEKCPKLVRFCILRFFQKEKGKCFGVIAICCRPTHAVWIHVLTDYYCSGFPTGSQSALFCSGARFCPCPHKTTLRSVSMSKPEKQKPRGPELSRSLAKFWLFTRSADLWSPLIDYLQWICPDLSRVKPPK